MSTHLAFIQIFVPTNAFFDFKTLLGLMGDCTKTNVQLYSLIYAA